MESFDNEGYRERINAFVEKYLEKLFEKYDVKEHMAGVLLDTDNRVSGDIKGNVRGISIAGKELSVYPYNYI